MELFDLKNSWNALDKQLQERDVVDTAKIAELIHKHQSGAAKSMLRITNWLKLSVGVGIVVVLFLLIVLFAVPLLFSDVTIHGKAIVMSLYFGVSIIAGMFWDLTTYRFSKSIKVDEMPVKMVIEEINRFRKWMKYEIIALLLWVIIFFGLYYWVEDYYNLPFFSQLLLIVSVIIIIMVTIYFIYKKVIYSNLIEMKKNLIELEELERNS